MSTVIRTTPVRERMRQELQLAGLSERTQEAYLRSVRQLTEHFRTPPIGSASNSSASTSSSSSLPRREPGNEKRLAPASLCLAFYAIQFFYRRTVPREWPDARAPEDPPAPDAPGRTHRGGGAPADRRRPHTAQPNVLSGRSATTAS